MPMVDGVMTAEIAFAADADMDVLVYTVPVADRSPWFTGLTDFDFEAASAANPEVTDFPVTAGQPIYISILRYINGSGANGGAYSITVWID